MTIKYVLPVCMTLAGFATAVDAQEVRHLGPKFSAKVNVGVLKVEDRDIDPWVFRTEVGLDGLFILNPHLKLKYDLLADMSGGINEVDELTWSTGYSADDTDSLHVKDARVILITDYGGFLIAPRVTSGHWVDLYGKIDIFEYNRFHAGTGAISLFGQPEQGLDALGYGSPEFLGGFKFLAATMHADDLNDEDVDIYAGRLIYDKGGLSAGIGHTVVRNEMFPDMFSKDYAYTTFSAAYDFGALRLAGVYEAGSNAPTVTLMPGMPPAFESADYDSFVVTAAYDITPKWTLSGGVAHKDHDVDAYDLKGTLLNLKYHFNDKIFMFVETGQYDEAPDNIATGIQISL